MSSYYTTNSTYGEFYKTNERNQPRPEDIIRNQQRNLREHEKVVNNYNNYDIRGTPIENEITSHLKETREHEETLRKHGEIKRLYEEKVNQNNEFEINNKVKPLNNVMSSYYDRIRSNEKITDNNNYNNNSNKNSIPLEDTILNSLTGFQNLGNTCYINTCLQNLIHNKKFINKFLSVFKEQSNSTPISNSFYYLLTQISENNTYEKNDSINPLIFVDTFKKLHKNFEGFQEHDTQEFCRYLLQDLNNELNQVQYPSSYKKEMAKNKTKKESFDLYVKDCLSKENSIITDLFIGYFSFEYKCECGFREYSFSQFLDLPIQMDANVQGFDLYQMLRNNFYKTSYVDMGETCSFCRRTSKKNEIMKIAKLPNILIISLQRINPKTGMKNNANVKFYEGLDLKEIIDPETQRADYTKYDLFAISNHIGSINTGHYYSNIKIGQNWYCFEDSKVYKIGPQIEMNTQEVYTLFYKMKGF
jgi:ubiquitin C-terminal hydrolase